MPPLNKKNNPSPPLFIFIALLIALVVFALSFNIIYRGKIYPRIQVANLNLGGKTKNEAQSILQDRINYFKNQGVSIFYKEREWPLREEDIGLTFKVNQTLDEVLLFGHEEDIIQRLKSQLVILTQGVNLPLRYELDEDKLDQYLKNNLTFLEVKPEMAEVILKNSGFEIKEEKTGQEIDLTELKQRIKNSLDNLQDQRIKVVIKESRPAVTRANVLDAHNMAEEMVQKPLKLTYEKKYWTVSPKMLVSWVDFQLNQDKVMEAGLKREAADAFLKNVAAEIEQEPENARFKIDNSRIVAFELGQEGKKIDFEETMEFIKNALQTPTEGSEKKAEITVRTVTPSVSNQNIDELGIRTLIGTGESDFTGSPSNRKHNIGVGSEKLNGVLIEPNEEFSIIQTLGEVSAATGYKPELVIKPEGTIPEFGGGLCQVSTTLFRAVIYSGLPITERKPHKYVVSYYKPTGMDATIYIPHPDLRFKNDTPGHILIQKRIIGNKLYFDFYGTDDDRKVKIEGPYYTSEWVSPSPPEYIETNTLKKGEKKQIEKEHKGVSTVFHRAVTRDGQEILRDSFYSKYQPWNAVFLVGTGGNDIKGEQKENTPPKIGNQQKKPPQPTEIKKKPSIKEKEEEE